MKNYLFEYRYDGDVYCFTIPADSLEEAKARAKAMSWARYEGEVFATIKVPTIGFGSLFRKLGLL